MAIKKPGEGRRSFLKQIGYYGNKLWQEHAVSVWKMKVVIYVNEREGLIIRSYCDRLKEISDCIGRWAEFI